MEYVRQIKELYRGASESGYIVDKIYIVDNKHTDNHDQGFINSNGLADGYNKDYFVSATKEEYDLQEGIINKLTIEEYHYLIPILKENKCI